VADALVKKSVWIVGGDGWAYDIGYGGLDHVLASGRNVNVLVLDTEVYSNTGGQDVQSPPRAARWPSSPPAASRVGKKDLGHDGHDLRQRLRGQGRHGRQRHAHRQGVPGSRSLRRAVAHHRLQPLHRPRLRPGPRHGSAEGRVNSGYWPLFRYNPDLVAQGKNPFQLDSRPPSIRSRTTSTTRPATPCFDSDELDRFMTEGSDVSAESTASHFPDLTASR
jgi:pyruvate-ferredoxin/flavodoxin oxidoreductase